MDDSEKIEIEETRDFYDICFAGLGSIRYKYYFLLFLLFLFVTSNVFVFSVLTRFKSAVEFQQVTMWGNIIQATTFIVLSMLIDLLTSLEII